MKTRTCCGRINIEAEFEAQNVLPFDSKAQPPRGAAMRRLLDFAGWLIPGVILAVLPKCPLCVAAYLSLATGIGIQISTAKSLRLILMSTCVLSLLYLAFRATRLLYATHPQSS